MLFQFLKWKKKTRKKSKYNVLGPQDQPKLIEKDEEASREDSDGSDGFLIVI